MIYNCENNYLDNLENRRLSSVLQGKIPWYLSENKSLLHHILVFDSKPTSTFYSLLEPIQKKILLNLSTISIAPMGILKFFQKKKYLTHKIDL